MANFSRIFVSFLLFLSVAGCGFHLRQPMPLAQPLKNIYVQSPDPYGDLTHNIKQYLRMSGVHLAASPKEAATILNITQEVLSQDLLSINSSQQTRQYNLRLFVTFEITDAQGKALAGPHTIGELRPLTLQSNQILAGSNQATQLYHDMRRSLTYSLMNWLSSKAVAEALPQNLNTQAPL
jgi:LPS-assembly lipoprotein